MTRIADVPGCTRSCTRFLKSPEIARSPAAPSAAPMMPPAAPTSGASGNRNNKPIRSPQNSPLSVPPRHRVVGWSRQVQLALPVAPDSSRVLQVDQVVVLQADEFIPDALRGGLIRVTDNDQVAHRVISTS